MRTRSISFRQTRRPATLRDAVAELRGTLFVTGGTVLLIVGTMLGATAH